MKTNRIHNLSVLDRPVALMLALIPAAALTFTYFAVHWTAIIGANAQLTNPELAMTIEGYATFFGDYAIPVLSLAVVLAVVNVCCAFDRRARVQDIP